MSLDLPEVPDGAAAQPAPAVTSPADTSPEAAPAAAHSRPVSDLLANAARLGFATSDEPLPVQDKAARMLPADSTGIGTSFQLRTLTVAVDHIPTPAEFAAFERSSGCEVSVCVVTETAWQTMRAVADNVTANRTSVWSMLSGVAAAGGEEAWVVPGSVVMIGDVSGWRALNDEVISASEVHDMLTDLRADDDVVCRTYNEDRWRVTTAGTATSPALHLRRLPLRIPRVDELGVPTAVVNAAAKSSGVIVVAGSAGSGRSTVAAALASRASLLSRRPLAVYGPVKERLPAAAGGPVWFVPAEAGPGEVCRSTGIVVVDDLDTTPAEWARMARAGNLVIAVSWSNRVLDAVDHPELAGTLLAAVAVLRLPSATGPVMVYETLSVDSSIRNALREGPNHVGAAAAAAGREVYRPFEVALAAAAASAVVSEEDAARAVVDESGVRSALEHLRT